MKKLLAVLISVFLLALGGLTLTACGEDELKTFEYATFKSQTYMYDGLEKSIEVDGVPNGTTVTYNPTNKQAEVGVYEITAKIEKDGYESKTLTATLTIVKSDKLYTIEEINVLLAELNNALTSTKAETETLISQIQTEYTTKINALTEQLNADKTALETLEKEYKDKVAELEETASANKEALENKLASDKAELNADIEALEKAYLEKVAELEETASANKEALENKLASDKAELNADIEALEKEYKDKVSELEATASANKTELENKLASDKAELNADIEALEKAYLEKVAELEETASANKTELENKLASDKAELTAKIQTLESQIASVEAEMNGKIADLTSNVTALENRIKELEDRIDSICLHLTSNFATVIEATCLDTGLIKKVCADCGMVIDVVSKEKLSHTESDWMVDKNATCIEKGSKHIECTECKTTLKAEEIGFIDHNYVYGECDVCDKIDTTYMSEGLAFTLINDGNGYAVSGYTENSAELLIPAIYRGKAVTTIKANAFENNVIIESVILPDSIKIIADRAFYYCTSLTSIDIPNSVTYIGDSAFYGCSSLASIEIPNSVTSIGNYAFNNCTSLTSVTIPDSVTSIGYGVFGNCSSLTSIVIPNSVTSIGSSAFECCRSLTSIAIPDSVTSIGSYAFEYCYSLTSIVIPNSVTSIGRYAFRDCANLVVYTEKIERPSGWDGYWNDGVKQVVWGTNYYTEGLIFELETSNEEEYRITGYEGTEENVVIPSMYNGKKVTSIENLIGYKSPETEVIKTVQIPNSITYMGSQTLLFGKNLTDVYYMGTVDEWAQIEFHAEQFDENYNQATLHFNGETFNELSVNVESISRYAFWGYPHVESVEIGEKVTTIGYEAFNGCSNLKEFKVSQNNAHFKAVDGVLYSKDGKTLVCYPHAKQGAIVIPSTVETIGVGAFNGNNLECITIPNTVKVLDVSAFNYCRNLKTVTFEDGSQIESIEGSVFGACYSLVSIQIPSSVTSIGDLAFAGCEDLTTVTFEAGSKLTSIGDSAFYYCTSLTSIEIPSSVTSIGDSAFIGCDKLNYNTKDNVRYVGTAENAYFYLVGPVASDISFAVINKDCKIISGEAFAYLSSLKTVIFEEGCKIDTIPTQMFRDCTALTSITLPENLTTIEDTAFWNCVNLESIILPESLTTIGYGVFRGCVALSIIRIPANVTTFGDLSFNNMGKEDLNGLIVYTPLTEKPEGWISSWSYGTTSVLWGVDNIEVDGDFIYTLINDGAEYELVKYVGSESSVKIPSTYNGKNVTSIGEDAFRDCSSLISVTMGNSVTSIGDYAFYRCSSLTSIVIPDSVTSIGERAFCNCTSLTSVVIGDSVTSIGSSAFYNCSSLTSVEIPNSVTSIGSSAFYYCKSLTSVVIGDSVTSIGRYAFTNCNNLETIYCKAESQPSGWVSGWKVSCSAEVVWGYND